MEPGNLSVERVPLFLMVRAYRQLEVLWAISAEAVVFIISLSTIAVDLISVQMVLLKFPMFLTLQKV